MIYTIPNLPAAGLWFGSYQTWAWRPPNSDLALPKPVWAAAKLGLGSYIQYTTYSVIHLL